MKLETECQLSLQSHLKTQLSEDAKSELTHVILSKIQLLMAAGQQTLCSLPLESLRIATISFQSKRDTERKSEQVRLKSDFL